MSRIYKFLCLCLLLLLIWPGTALAKPAKKTRDRQPPRLTWLKKPNPPLVSGGSWLLNFRLNEKARIWLSVYNNKGNAVVRPLNGRWYRPSPLAVNLNLKNWPPGQYTLWLTAQDSSGNRSRWKMAVQVSPRSVTIVPTSNSGTGANAPSGSAANSGSAGNSSSGSSNNSGSNGTVSPPPASINPIQPSLPPATPGSSGSAPEPGGMTPEEQALYYAVPRVDEVKNSAIPGYAIRFYLAEESYCSIKIYNSQQQVVAVIYDRPTQPLPDGLNTVVWDKKVTLEPGRTDWASPGTYTWEVIVKKGDGTIVNRFTGEIVIS